MRCERIEIEGDEICAARLRAAASDMAETQRPVGGALPGGQVNCARREPTMKGAAVAARVDDRQSLRGICDFGRDLIPGLALPRRGHRNIDPVQGPEERRRIWRDFNRRETL